MAEKSLTVVVQKVGNNSPCMHKITASERKKLFKEARLVHRQPELDIRLLKKDKETSPLGRILVVTPKKIGNAPKRNLIRRRLKSLFHEEGWDQRPYDLLIYCQKGSADLSFQELKQILSSLYTEQA
jgi:ribonuclease P protein component